MTIKQLNRYVGPLFVVLIVFFFIFYLKDIDMSVFLDVRIAWIPLVAATLISLGFRYWGVFIWKITLQSLGATTLPNFRILTAIYAKAWMARYIPGTVVWIGSKIYLANKHGISKSRLAVSSLIEAGTQVAATMTLALLLLSADTRLDVISWQVKLAMLSIGALVIIGLHPPLFNFALRRFYTLVRRKKAPSELKTNYRTILRSYTLYFAGAVIAGTSYYYLAVSLSDSVTPEMFWYIVGASSLAGALGMATPFVPSGIGVREGVQLVLLSLILPKEIALVITIASRLLSAGVDVLFYGLAVVFNPNHTPQGKL